MKGLNTSESEFGQDILVALNDIAINKDIKERFREIKQKGYASQRYSDENKRFLTLFCINPEIIILYWKIKGKVVKK